MSLTDQDIQKIAGHHEDQAGRIAAGETTLGMVLKLSPEELEAMYALAYNQYEHEKYEEAGRIFALLVAFAPSSYKYCLGLGMSVYRFGRIDDALLAFTHCLLLDPMQPEAHLYLAECMIRRGEMDNVRESLEQVLFLTEDEDGYAHLHNRARIILENLLGVKPEEIEAFLMDDF